MHKILVKKTYTQILRYITLLITIGVAFTGCSGSSGGATGGDTTNPTVISTSIIDNAIGVSEAITSLTADFSEQMDASTLTPLTFTLSGPNGTIPVTVSYSGITATMNISSTLDYSTIYIARISTAAKDVAGNGLAADSEWRFTTLQSPDVTAPRVSSTNPSNGATGVAIDRAINAIFSEPLNCATVDASSFFVNGSAAGNVSCSGTTVTFTLNTPLTNSTTYIATMTSGIQDLAGNALANNYTWSFTTGTAADTTAPQVSSTNPVDNSTGITINSAINATFTEPLNCNSVDATSFIVSGPSGVIAGNISCSGDTATFTSSSDLNFNAAYTATITTGVKDLSDNAIATNYSWNFTTATNATSDTRAPNVSSTSPANNATGIDINNQVSVVFSEPMDAASITTASFTLTGPSGNVKGTVAYNGTTATFTLANSLAFSTSYTATITNTAQDLAGNIMLSNYGWIFTTGAAPDTTSPLVISTTPSSGETIAVDSLFKAVFSEPLDCATVDASSFSVDNGVTGNVSCNNDTVTFIPSSNLAYSTSYTAALSTAITDLAGNSLSSIYSWTVTTSVAPDTTAPTVSSSSPANAETGVTINTTISAVFDEALDCTTVDSTSFLVDSGVTGTVSCSGSIATFVPDSTLASSATYIATITNGVQDLAGNALAADYVWNFTTAVAGDSIAPTVVSTTPVNGATSIANNSVITAVFSEQLNCTTVTTASFSLDNGASGGVTCSDGTATFTPDSNLTYNTTYTATITTGVQDLSGNSLATNYGWSFTIETAPDLTGPVVNSTVPVNMGTNIVTESIPTVTFDEALDCSTVNNASFTLSGTTVGPVTGNVSCSGTSASFTPTSKLKFGEVYTVTLTTSITDLLANPITAVYNWSFTTLTLPWIKQFGSSNYDDVRSVAVDPTTGVIYLAGATLGGIDGKTNAGGWDIFLTKYSAAGTKIWTEQLGTSTDDNVRDMTVDSSGNVYLTGYSGGSIVDGTVSATIDSFLVKYDSNGTFQWAKSIGTSFDDIAHGVVTDTSDNVYMAGFTYGNLLSDTANNGADLFLIKYDSSGTEIWRRQYGNSTDELFISGIDIDTNDNLYLSGSTFGTLAINPTPDAGGEDALLIKYDANGNRQWISQFGGGSDERATAVAIDSNTIYVVGRTQDANGSIDLYLTKFDSAGIPQLSTQLGNSGVDDVAHDIAVVASGNIYVTGYTDSSLGENSSGGGQDVILVKFDSNLNNTWIRQLGTSENDIGYGVASDGSANAFVGGYTLGTLEHNVNSGLSDAFVVKYDTSGIRQ